ncbi:MAG TPA: tRNA (adenosine(37)-N6)-threonylcarbamoyltransferase complex ATPase subunit type 1 TsaE, partial [Coleofasciculaceae cyanobacterium]
VILSLPTAADTRSLGKKLGQSLPTGTVILLNGGLGAGKTTLVQGLGAGLGISEPIDSPTFTLINEYESGRMPLYHLDLYRLDQAASADLYPEVYWQGEEVKPGIVAIEWAERLPYRPTDYLEISLSQSAAEGRTAKIQPQGNVAYPSL